MKQFLLISCLLVLVSCTGIKELPTNIVDYPSWITSRPIASFYYIGIAKSSKSNPDYQAIAKQNALLDLSSEISVILSSESIFHQVDKGNTYREEYQSLVQIESQNNLEGYTMVASWEDETEYWLYYQLSISEWDLIRVKRKNKAIEDAYTYYKLAKKYEAENKFVSSVHYAIKGLDLLKLYMNEPLAHAELAQPIDVLCLQFLSDAYDSIDYKMLSGTQNREQLFMGNLSVVNPIEVIVAKENIPFKIRSTIKGTPSKLNSDAAGVLSISLENVDVNRAEQFVQFTLDWEFILREANASVWLQSLLKFPENSFKVSLKPLRPKIAISSKEFNLGETMSQAILLNEATNYLKAKGFEITDVAESDLVISITANTTKGLTNSRMHTAMLEYEFVVSDMLGKVIYQSQERALKGVQASFQTAGVNAYERSLDEFKWEVLRGFVMKMGAGI